MIAFAETGRNANPGLTLQALKEAYFNGHAGERTDLDVLGAIARDKQGLLQRVSENKELVDRVGGRRKLRREVDGLTERYKLQLHELAATETFQEKVQKKGIIRRMLGAVKNHPIAALILVLAASAGGFAGAAYMAGGVEALLAQVGLSHLYGSAGAAEASKVLGKVIEGGKNLLPNIYDAPTAGEMH